MMKREGEGCLRSGKPETRYISLANTCGHVNTSPAADPAHPTPRADA